MLSTSNYEHMEHVLHATQGSGMCEHNLLTWNRSKFQLECSMQDRTWVVFVLRKIEHELGMLCENQNILQDRQLSIWARKVTNWGLKMLSDVIINFLGSSQVCQQDRHKIVNSHDFGHRGYFNRRSSTKSWLIWVTHPKNRPFFHGHNSEQKFNGLRSDQDRLIR